MIASLLLPTSVLSSGWFRAFSLFVAANTIIYLGLTLAKFMPWPKQVQPRQVRAMLHQSETADDVSLFDDDDLVVGTGTKAKLIAGRRSAASLSIYRALGLLGLLILAVTMVNVLLFARGNPLLAAGTAGFGVICLLASLTLGRRRDLPIVAEWTWSILAVLFVLGQCCQAAIFHNPLDIADAIIVLVVIPPVALSWPASLVGSGVAATATSAAAISIDGARGLSAIITVITASAAGLILLYLRAKAIDENTLARSALRKHRTSDPVTGLLSLEALMDLAPNLSSLASLSDQAISVAQVRIENLDLLRDDYGSPYGRELRTVVGQVLSEIANPGDLVADATGGTYVLVGIGPKDEASLLAALDAGIEAATVSLGKAPVSLSASIEMVGPIANLNALVARAEQS